MKVCHNCEVHSICPELDIIIDADGEELEFCSDYCREQFIEDAKPQVTTALVYWCDGDIGYIKRLAEQDAVGIMQTELQERGIDFDITCQQLGVLDCRDDNIWDLINVVNFHNSVIGNPVTFYFKEIE